MRVFHDRPLIEVTVFVISDARPNLQCFDSVKRQLPERVMFYPFLGSYLQTVCDSIATYPVHTAAQRLYAIINTNRHTRYQLRHVPQIDTAGLVF